MVQMRGVDLQQFQFDFDLTWAAFFLRADGTVYARYGSRDETGPMSRNSIEGLTNTMKRVLAVHREYPKHQARYRDKRGPAPKYARPELMPAPTIKRITANATSSNNCIHCHNLYDAQHELLVEQDQYDPRKLWKYPLPENFGLKLDKLTGTRVEKIEEGSAADLAGLKQGDELVTAMGQALHSLADLQFVLHFLPQDQPLRLTVRRPTQSVDPIEIVVPLIDERFAGWRRRTMSWRVSMYGMPPKPGLWVDTLAAAKHQAQGLAEDRLALEVRGLFGNDVRKSELKKGDIIIALDGSRKLRTPAEFHEQLRLTHYRPGSIMKLTVIRQRQTREIEVRF